MCVCRCVRTMLVDVPWQMQCTQLTNLRGQNNVTSRKCYDCYDITSVT